LKGVIKVFLSKVLKGLFKALKGLIKDVKGLKKALRGLIEALKGLKKAGGVRGQGREGGRGMDLAFPAVTGTT
jgi:hypothetical protein